MSLPAAEALARGDHAEARRLVRGVDDPEARRIATYLSPDRAAIGVVALCTVAFVAIAAIYLAG